MNRQARPVIRMMVWALLVPAAPSVAMADYAIESYTIQAGGATSSGGGFVLTGTIEATDPNPRVMTGDGFELAGELCPAPAEADGETADISQCGRGIEEALPLLLIGLVGFCAVTRRRSFRI